MSNRSLHILICRCALSAVFIGAGILKLLDPVEFALSVQRYEILPAALITPTAKLIPWFELVAGVALLCVRRYREAAEIVMVTLLLGFTAAIAAARIRGLDMPCGCFGSSWAQLQTAEWSITRNLILIALAVLVFSDCPSGEARSRPVPG